jgi:hercynylcysteine S-oxide lyase
MGEASLDIKMGEVSLNDGRTPFGKEMLKHFLFDPNFKNLNQGIFPSSIVSKWYIDTRN